MANILVKCKTCGKEFMSRTDKIAKGYGIFCCQPCFQQFIKSQRIGIVCETCKKTFFVPNSQSVKKFCSQACYNEKLRREWSGCKNPNWKNGITPKNHNIRGSANYINWRTLVFQRDNYTCQKCGKSNCYLNAHHIIPFSADKSLRFEVSNGISLCVKCHNKEHLRLSKKKNKQIDIFECSRYPKRKNK